MQTFKQYHEARSLAIRAKKAGVDLTGIDQDELLKGIEIEREHDGERGKDVDVVGPKIDLVKIFLKSIDKMK